MFKIKKHKHNSFCVGNSRHNQFAVFLFVSQTPAPAQHGDPQLPADSAVHRGHDGPDLYPVPERPHNPRDPGHGGGPDQRPEQRGLPGPGPHAACSSPLATAGDAGPGAARGCEGQTGAPVVLCRAAGKPRHRTQPAQKLRHPPQGENDMKPKSFITFSLKHFKYLYGVTDVHSSKMC